MEVKSSNGLHCFLKLFLLSLLFPTILLIACSRGSNHELPEKPNSAEKSHLFSNGSKAKIGI